MKKFVIYVDYITGKGPKCGYSYELIKATDLMDAIRVADNKFSDRVYLMRIMEKQGKIKIEEGWKVETYEAILARRSSGWHCNTIENAENEHTAERHFYKDMEYFTAV